MYINIPEDGDNEIKIDFWDTYSADVTLAKIIYPMLIQLQKRQNIIPQVDNIDVPSNLQSDIISEALLIKRWDYVLNEMIWTFDNIAHDPNYFAYDDEIRADIKKGTMLFGKYFDKLWD